MISRCAVIQHYKALNYLHSYGFEELQVYESDLGLWGEAAQVGHL